MAEFEGKEVVGTPKEFAIYLVLNIAIGVGLFFLLKDMKQTLAGTIFIALVIGTLMFWRFRVAIAFIGIVLLLLTRTIDLQHTIEFMSLDVILFLVGMMVIVGLLRRSGFFRWLLAQGLKFSNFEPNRLMLIILALAAVMAAMADARSANVSNPGSFGNTGHTETPTGTDLLVYTDNSTSPSTLYYVGDYIMGSETKVQGDYSVAADGTVTQAWYPGH